MQLSYKLLKELVDLKGTGPEELARLLTVHTVEVEGLQKQSAKFDNVVVGKILEVTRHPNADRLRLAQVDTGKERLGIVCGAPNIEAGQLVPVALVGAILPNGAEIKEAEVRGEKSCGMLCAADELGLGDDHSGIVILDEKAKVGQPFAEYLELDDIVLEVDNKSLSNRPDLFSHLGIAREISAILETELTERAKRMLGGKIDFDGVGEAVAAKVDDFKLCLRYMSLRIDGLKIEPSPKWMQNRLISAGIRPINNIVDITNYVLIEMGQPTHAFDAAKLDKIVVRSAKKDELIRTLDGVERKLEEGMIVVTDGSQAIALAGIMGGEASEVSNSTTAIVLEVANFDYVSIRKTSQKLNLRTEASVRYEKGLDPNLCEIALVRAVELFKEICPEARVSGKLIDEKKFSLNQGPIAMNLEWLNRIIGAEIPKDKALGILKRLGFGIEGDGDELKITVPTWRATRDVDIKEDIAEEVARIYGYDNIPCIMPRADISAPEKNEERSFEREIKKILIGGPAMTEVHNYSFVGEELLRKIGIDFSSHIKLVNPLASQHSMLRQNLAPNFFENIRINQARYAELSLFEIGSVFLPLDGELPKDNDSKEKLPYQEKRLGMAFAGEKIDQVFDRAKGTVAHLAESFGLQFIFDQIEMVPNWANEKYSCLIKIGNEQIGFVHGAIKDISRKMGVKKELVIVEIRLGILMKAARSANTLYRPFEKFPPLSRDLAFVVDEKISYNNIRNEIAAFNELIRDVELFDVYVGDRIGAGNKNLAFHVTYQADRTLTSAEVDEIQDGLIKKLEEKFEAKIRNY